MADEGVNPWLVEPFVRRIGRSNSVPEMKDIRERPPLPYFRLLPSTHLPSFKIIAILFILFLAIGTVCFYFLSDQIKGDKTNGILDSIYFCIMIMTTVGYGDLVPNSVPTKLLACIFVFLGVTLVSLIVSIAADNLVEKQQKLFIEALYMRQELGPTIISREIETDSVRYARFINSAEHKCFMTICLMLVLVIFGTVFLVTVERLDLIDAFYCVCTTITTLGYGDKSFSTVAGRFFAIFWILASTLSASIVMLCC